jgi:hypothetical protein
MGKESGISPEAEQLHTNLRQRVEALIRGDAEEVYRISRIEGFGVFTLPDELIWKMPGIIPTEDRYRLFTEATLHASVTLPQSIATGEARKTRLGTKHVIEKIPGSMLLAINIGYANQWRTTSNVETSLQLAATTPVFQRERSIETWGVGKDPRQLRKVILHRESHAATLEELQVLDGVFRYVETALQAREAIRAANTRPIYQSAPATIPSIRELSR